MDVATLGREDGGRGRVEKEIKMGIRYLLKRTRNTLSTNTE